MGKFISSCKIWLTKILGYFFLALAGWEFPQCLLYLHIYGLIYFLLALLCLNLCCWTFRLYFWRSTWMGPGDPRLNCRNDLATEGREGFWFRHNCDWNFKTRPQLVGHISTAWFNVIVVPIYKKVITLPPQITGQLIFYAY